MKIIKYAILILILIPLGLNAQEKDSVEKISHHDHRHNEIGVGNSSVYFINERVLSYGLHIHYMHNLPKTKLGIGVGYEKIFDKHNHNTLGIIFCYMPVEKLSFSISPGLLFENNEFDKSQLAVHFETVYEFEFNDFHYGPVLEIAAGKEDFHISLGLHLGIGF